MPPGQPLISKSPLVQFERTKKTQKMLRVRLNIKQPRNCVEALLLSFYLNGHIVRVLTTKRTQKLEVKLSCLRVTLVNCLSS